MFGWLKRRLLARKCRKAVKGVQDFEVERQVILRNRSAAAERRAFPPAYSPSPSLAPPHQVDPLGINQALLLSAVLDDDRRSADCSGSFGSDSSSSSSSWSGASDSSSSCSSSSSSSWD